MNLHDKLSFFNTLPLIYEKNFLIFNIFLLYQISIIMSYHYYNPYIKGNMKKFKVKYIFL